LGIEIGTPLASGQERNRTSITVIEATLISARGWAATQSRT
jgi:hypothetical protein